ncbi:MAG: silent information regulator protein Sir2 [Candidatus Lokiarchaeota archaeon]|nr:silent information regulator protein Sir2 [Candidatus Lokiarchaeota archaeon]
MKKKTKSERRKIRLKVLKFLFLFGIILTSSYFSGYGIYRLIIWYKDFSTPIEYTGGDRITESLDRGLVAIYNNNGDVYISWRLLKSDPVDVSFNLYQYSLPGPPVKLNSFNINQTTDFIVLNSTHIYGSRYFIRSIVDSLEQDESKWVSVANQFGQPYISIPLNGSDSANRIGIADVDGDGTYDFVVKIPNTSLDPLGRPFNPNRGWIPSPGTYIIEAYGSNFSNGTSWQHLWTKDLGWNIEQGIWYSPFIVYDLDGDGYAEIAVKTGDIDIDYRGSSGRVKKGPEYVSIWNGRTGELITQEDWIPRSARIYSWNSRNQMGIAYLDGVHPSLLIERGTYAKMELRSYNFDGLGLNDVWDWNSKHEQGWKGYDSQGAHFLHSVDVDGDRCDEIILGACAIDQTGVGLWNSKLGHPDHAYVGDIDPNRPGLEVYVGIEGKLAPFPEYKNGYALLDAATGEVIWGSNETTHHVHSQGLVADIDSNHEGMECYSGENDYSKIWLHSAKGVLLGDENSLMRDLSNNLSPKAVYWDADPQRELLINNRLFDYSTNITFSDEIPRNQNIWADILGDWREEIICTVNGEIRIYLTTIPAVDRRVCLMQDPLYRLDVAHLSMGYPQVPTTSYCIANV